MIKVLGIEGISTKRQREVLREFEKLSKLLILDCILESLSKKEQTVFLKLAQEGKEKRLFKFLKEKIPNLEKKITEAILREISNLI